MPMALITPPATTATPSQRPPTASAAATHEPVVKPRESRPAWATAATGMR